jgi:hypothetical protein
VLPPVSAAPATPPSTAPLTAPIWALVGLDAQADSIVHMLTAATAEEIFFIYHSWREVSPEREQPPCQMELSSKYQLVE